MGDNVTSGCPLQFYNETLPGESETTKQVALSIFVLSVVYVVVSEVLFVSLQSRYSRLRVRPVWSIVVVGLGVICCAGVVCLREYVGRQFFPCDALGSLILLLLPLWGIPLYVRLSHYKHMIRWNMEKRVVQVPDDPQHTPLNVATFDSDKAPSDQSVSNEMKYLLVLQYNASWSRNILLIAAVGVPSLIVITTSSYFGSALGRGCVGCKVSLASKYTVMGFLVMYSTLLLWSIYRIRRDFDHHGVVAETRNAALLLLAALVAWAIMDVVDISNVEANGSTSWGYILLLGALTTFTVMGPYQIVVAMRSTGFSCELPCKSEKKFLGMFGRKEDVSHALKRTNVSMSSEGPSLSDTHRSRKRTHSSTYMSRRRTRRRFDTLRDVVQTRIGIDSFSMHLAAELCTEDIRFWMEANMWKSNYFSGISPQARQKKAEAIFATFLSPRAVMRVKVSDEVLNNLKRYFGLRRLGVKSTEHSKPRYSKKRGKTHRFSGPSFLPVIVSSGFSSTSASTSKLEDAMQSVAAQQAEQEMLPAPSDVFDQACLEVFENMERKHFHSFKKSTYYRSLMDGSLYEKFGLKPPESPSARKKIDQVV